MASAGSRALPKMAAGGPARRAAGRSRTEPRGPALSGRRRRRPPGRCAKGSPEGKSPATASAEPAGEGARRQERGGPRRQSPTSSHKVSDRRPSKRLKCEKNSLVKSELEGLTRGSAALGETPETPDGDQCSEDPGDCNVIKQKKDKSIPETNAEKQEKEHSVSLEPRAEKSSSSPPKTGRDENLHNHVCPEEESSCESALSEGSSLEDGDPPQKPLQLDNSAFLDEDSNQPMPVDRFFGDMEFIQDLPPVPLPTTTMSRREFRRLHFIAKEDDEEEEDVV
uniref:Chromosome 1 open reading frame 174 n=1 Tax=Calidris pygmaea TaxID=425635 RepID=A0A8C3K6T7_9CHAR